MAVAYEREIFHPPCAAAEPLEQDWRTFARLLGMPMTTSCTCRSCN